MKIAAENCRVLGNRPTVRGLRELQRREVPDILFLSETKLDEKRMDKFRWILDMPHMIAQKSESHSGSLAMLWN
jgi:exonuclease III